MHEEVEAWVPKTVGRVPPGRPLHSGLVLSLGLALSQSLSPPGPGGEGARVRIRVRLLLRRSLPPIGKMGSF